MKRTWTLNGLTWKEFGLRLWQSQSEMFGRAAQLSYYFLLAIIPMLLCLTSITGFVMGSHSGLTHNFFEYLSELMPPAAFELVRAAMLDIRKGTSGGTLSFGLLAALWAASSGVDAIGNSLNAAYAVKETRPWWKTRAIAVGLTLGFATLTVVALVLVLYGGRIADIIQVYFGFDKWFSLVWRIVQYPIVISFILCALALVYYCLPNLKVRNWKWITPGSVVGTALWLLASLGFRAYLHYFDTYSKTYGSLGAVIVLMLWLYMTSAAILLGGRINSEIERAVENGELNPKVIDSTVPSSAPQTISEKPKAQA